MSCPIDAIPWQLRYSLNTEFVCGDRVGQVECAVCPRTGGLFKPTTQGGWAHLACALWVPECEIIDAVKMEPIVAKLTKQRQALRCELCGVRGGGSIQWCALSPAALCRLLASFDQIVMCSAEDKCYAAFHPLCAYFSGLSLRVVEDHAGLALFRAFCRKHSHELAAEHARQVGCFPPALSRQRNFEF